LGAVLSDGTAMIVGDVDRFRSGGEREKHPADAGEVQNVFREMMHEKALSCMAAMYGFVSR
jgi:hypothetical protein